MVCQRAALCRLKVKNLRFTEHWPRIAVRWLLLFFYPAATNSSGPARRAPGLFFFKEPPHRRLLATSVSGLRDKIILGRSCLLDWVGDELGRPGLKFRVRCYLIWV